MPNLVVSRGYYHPDHEGVLFIFFFIRSPATIMIWALLYWLTGIIHNTHYASNGALDMGVYSVQLFE